MMGEQIMFLWFLALYLMLGAIHAYYDCTFSDESNQQMSMTFEQIKLQYTVSNNNKKVRRDKKKKMHFDNCVQLYCMFLYYEMHVYIGDEVKNRKNKRRRNRTKKS